MNTDLNGAIARVGEEDRRIGRKRRASASQGDVDRVRAAAQIGPATDRLILVGDRRDVVVDGLHRDVEVADQCEVRGVAGVGWSGPVGRRLERVVSCYHSRARRHLNRQ